MTSPRKRRTGSDIQVDWIIYIYLLNNDNNWQRNRIGLNFFLSFAPKRRNIFKDLRSPRNAMTNFLVYTFNRPRSPHINWWAANRPLSKNLILWQLACSLVCSSMYTYDFLIIRFNIPCAWLSCSLHKVHSKKHFYTWSEALLIHTALVQLNSRKLWFTFRCDSSSSRSRLGNVS